MKNWQLEILNNQKSVIRMKSLLSGVLVQWYLLRCCVCIQSDTSAQLQVLCWHLDTQPVTRLSQSGLQLEELETEALNNEAPLEFTQDWHRPEMFKESRLLKRNDKPLK